MITLNLRFSFQSSSTGSARGTSRLHRYDSIKHRRAHETTMAREKFSHTNAQAEDHHTWFSTMRSPSAYPRWTKSLAKRHPFCHTSYSTGLIALLILTLNANTISIDVYWQHFLSGAPLMNKITKFEHAFPSLCVKMRKTALEQKGEARKSPPLRNFSWK